MHQKLGRRLRRATRPFEGEGTPPRGWVRERCLAIRRALLAAGLSEEAAHGCSARVEARVLGARESPTLEAALIAELVEVLGGPTQLLPTAAALPGVVLIAGLDGPDHDVCANFARFVNNERDRVVHIVGPEVLPRREVLFVAPYTKSEAALTSLRWYAKELSLRVFHIQGAPAPEVCLAALEHAKAQAYDLLVVDASPCDDDELARVRALESIRTVVGKHDVLLSVSAAADLSALSRARELHRRIGFDGVILSEVEHEPTGRFVLNIAAETGAPIRYVDGGEWPDTLEYFVPERFVSELLDSEHARMLAGVTPAQRAAAAAWRAGVNGLDSTVDLVRLSIKRPPKLGRRHGLYPEELLAQVDDSVISGLRALCRSMTHCERLAPWIIDEGRGRRICRGAGQSASNLQLLLMFHRCLQPRRAWADPWRQD